MITKPAMNELVQDCYSSVSMAWNDLNGEIKDMSPEEQEIAKEGLRALEAAMKQIEKLKR